jgi:hypothetical protein
VLHRRTSSVQLPPAKCNVTGTGACYVSSMQRLMRTLLACCYIWLLLSAGWHAQASLPAFGARAEQRVWTDALATGELLRVHNVEIVARVDGREQKAEKTGAGDNAASILGTRSTARHGCARCFFCCRSSFERTDFLAYRIQYPRAPPT